MKDKDLQWIFCDLVVYETVKAIESVFPCRPRAQKMLTAKTKVDRICCE